MTPARAAGAFLLAAAVLAAGCGGETETVTVTETQTVTETAPAEGPDDRAFQLAEDVCGALPREFVAPFLGADPRDGESLAEALAQRVRPELREAARDGCLEALRAEDGAP